MSRVFWENYATSVIDSGSYSLELAVEEYDLATLSLEGRGPNLTPFVVYLSDSRTGFGSRAVAAGVGSKGNHPYSFLDMDTLGTQLRARQGRLAERGKLFTLETKSLRSYGVATANFVPNKASRDLALGNPFILPTEGSLQVLNRYFIERGQGRRERATPENIHGLLGEVEQWWEQRKKTDHTLTNPKVNWGYTIPELYDTLKDEQRKTLKLVQKRMDFPILKGANGKCYRFDAVAVTNGMRGTQRAISQPIGVLPYALGDDGNRALWGSRDVREIVNSLIAQIESIPGRNSATRFRIEQHLPGLDCRFRLPTGDGIVSQVYRGSTKDPQLVLPPSVRGLFASSLTEKNYPDRIVTDKILRGYCEEEFFVWRLQEKEKQTRTTNGRHRKVGVKKKDKPLGTRSVWRRTRLSAK